MTGGKKKFVRVCQATEVWNSEMFYNQKLLSASDPDCDRGK